MLSYAGYDIIKWRSLMGNPSFPNKCWATFYVAPGACFSVKLKYIDESAPRELRQTLEKVFGMAIFSV